MVVLLVPNSPLALTPPHSFCTTHLPPPPLPCSFVLWLSGLLVNLHSDAILRRLRRLPGDGYKIPRGGMFEYVSGANFFGECVEWTGYAVATGETGVWVFVCMGGR